jgi:hypothetical protein
MPENTVSTGNTVRPTGSISHPSDRLLRPNGRMADADRLLAWGDIIHVAEQAGYERGRAAGLAEAWRHQLDTPEAPPFTAAQVDLSRRQQAHRAKCDQWAAVPHRRDYRGGPVAVWE